MSNNISAAAVGAIIGGNSEESDGNLPDFAAEVADLAANTFTGTDETNSRGVSIREEQDVIDAET